MHSRDATCVISSSQLVSQSCAVLWATGKGRRGLTVSKFVVCQPLFDVLHSAKAAGSTEGLARFASKGGLAWGRAQTFVRAGACYILPGLDLIYLDYLTDDSID